MSEDSAKIIKDNPCEKITMMQQSSTEERSTIDSRRHQNVSQSVNVSSLETVCLLSNYCQMLNQVLKVYSGTCQQFVEDVVKISNIFVFIVGVVEIFVVYT